jgi:energy-coupling factor transporter ATP-binding protein EcfA2
MLDIKDLTVRYRNRSKPSVSGLTTHVGRGEFVLLAGDSASGKSTAMQAVCGFIPHIVPADVSGEVVLDGARSSDPLEIARLVGMVQQDPEAQFCTETVEQEVAFGPENYCFPASKVRDQVDRALRSVNAIGLLDRKLSTLSGGEQQKVAIASVLAVSPKILMLDEPTSSLDPRAIREVIAAISEMRKATDVTTIVAEHRLKGFTPLASRILMMSEGKLVVDCVPGDPKFAELTTLASSPSEYPKVERRSGPAVFVDRLSFSIGQSRILDDVSFVLEEGSVTAIMGENGAGKTTLLRHLVGLIRVQEGSIRVLGHAMTKEDEVDPWVLGKDVGVVFQNPNHQIFESTVDGEIQFASANFHRDPAEADLAVARFEESEVLSRRVHPLCLSLGQKRRVNILSSSSHGPKLLLLDEPFIGQDRGNSKMIAQMIASLQRAGRTVMVVTHDSEFARSFCTDILFLKSGKVLAFGDIHGAIAKTFMKSMEDGE